MPKQTPNPTTATPKDKSHSASRPVLKSSVAARRLIKAALRRAGSQEKAAKLLRLPTQAQLSAMLRGRKADTAAMRLALQRADRRAEAARYFFPPEADKHIDRELIERAVEKIHKELAHITALLQDYCPQHSEEKQDEQPSNP